MKLEAAAGLRHLCTKDTPSLNISFPYAKADTGRTGSSLVTRAPPLASFHVPAASERLEEKRGLEKGSSGSRLVRTHLISTAEAERGKSPYVWVGWATHQQEYFIHTSESVTP